MMSTVTVLDLAARRLVRCCYLPCLILCATFYDTSTAFTFDKILQTNKFGTTPTTATTYTRINSERERFISTIQWKGISSLSSSSTSNIQDKEKSIDKSNMSLLLSRSTEIGSIVSKLIIPLVSSATSLVLRNNKKAAEVKDDNEVLWEAYWLSESKVGGSYMSNADRVVSALEQLGPTYVKFGQAVASRPDIIPKSLAASLSTLQDGMTPFDTNIAKEIIENELRSVGDTSKVNEDSIAILLDSLSEEPVAAASVGQVYKGYLPGVGHVAVKVQRPALQEMVEKDAALLRTIASFIESIPNPNPTTSAGTRLVNTELVAAVDEFMSRLFEELDYTNEAANAKKFAQLYSNKYGTARATLPGNGVIVPEIIDDFSTHHVLVMEWIDGTKLTSFQTTTKSQADGEEQYYFDAEKEENLELIERALYITLSQLLEFGVMHADPHNGNLLKVRQKHNTNNIRRRSRTKNKTTSTLAYLDFGLLATIPSKVRDGLVCAVAQLIFSNDVDAVASLFAELDLIEHDILRDPIEKNALTDALTKTLQEVLVYPNPTQTILDNNNATVSTTNTRKRKTDIPILKFDKLLDGLVRLVPRFKFQLPPYFINNARALGTLEGTARTINPNFNAFSIMYPYALNRILRNPTNSIIVDTTLQKMIRCDSGSKKIDRKKVMRILSDSATFTGVSRWKVTRDILKTKNGRKFAREVILQMLFYFRNK